MEGGIKYLDTLKPWKENTSKKSPDGCDCMFIGIKSESTEISVKEKTNLLDERVHIGIESILDQPCAETWEIQWLHVGYKEGVR